METTESVDTPKLSVLTRIKNEALNHKFALVASAVIAVAVVYVVKNADALDVSELETTES